MGTAVAVVGICNRIQNHTTIPKNRCRKPIFCTFLLKNKNHHFQHRNKQQFLKILVCLSHKFNNIVDIDKDN